MSDNTHAIDSRSENQDLVFKISKVDGILLNYFGSKHFLPKNSTEKIIGRSLYSIIGLSSHQELIHHLSPGSSSIVSYFDQNVSINGKTFEMRLVEADETQLLAILGDITEKQGKKELLLQSEKKFKDVFNSIVDVFYKTNADRRFVIMSPSIERISGLKPEAFIGKKQVTL